MMTRSLAALLCLATLLVGCASTGLDRAAPEPMPVAREAAASSIAHSDPAAATSQPSARSDASDAAPIDASALRAASPLMRLDPGADAERSDLWQRIRAGFSMPDVDDEVVRKWEQFYASRPDYVARMTERGARYLFHIVEEIDRRGMPQELALLPFIESAFNPQALSRASASGMWQFMPATGRSMELKQNVFRDDRRHVLTSTRAALDYLQSLYARFGDWHLALAAYNWGQGNVNRALTLNERRGQPREYLQLRMPNETRDYVPKLQAMKNIVLRPEAFALRLPLLENHPQFLSVAIQHDIDVELAARLSGLTVEAFQQLNPQLNKPVILAAGTPHVLLPYDNANQFLKGLDSHRGAMASWTAWRAPRTLKPVEAAKLVGMSEDSLRQVNRIPARMLVTVGSILVVPRSAKVADNVAEHIADNASLTLTPEARTKRSGSTVAAKGARRASTGKGASRSSARHAATKVAAKPVSGPRAKVAPPKRRPTHPH